MIHIKSTGQSLVGFHLCVFYKQLSGCLHCSFNKPHQQPSLISGLQWMNMTIVQCMDMPYENSMFKTIVWLCEYHMMDTVLGTIVGVSIKANTVAKCSECYLS